MHILKIVLLIAAIVIAVPLILALFIKKQYYVQRDIVINKPKGQVFDYIKYLKNQDNYSVWVRKDPGMKKDFRGNDGTVGFVYAWDGNKDAGKGEQEIKRIQEGERIDVEVRFIRPFEGIADAPLITESAADNQTKVIWGLKGESKYPFNIMNLFIDNVLGKDLEKSLVMLKGILEKP